MRQRVPPGRLPPERNDALLRGKVAAKQLILCSCPTEACARLAGFGKRNRLWLRGSEYAGMKGRTDIYPVRPRESGDQAFQKEFPLARE